MPARRPIPDQDRRRVHQIRRAAIVMACAMVLWVGGQIAGGLLGWPVRVIFLFDLAAIAALVWALVVTYWVWKERKQSEPRG
ncbi:DUF5337 domain-containing protein [Gymnodinialimonas sp. 2305UL16-5]|uniref:DUF5337 domain-containing protein n=1 Tax=Gymnodinialimonas mytili TaxID=3126503 RepID=UPI0030B16051